MLTRRKSKENQNQNQQQLPASPEDEGQARRQRESLRCQSESDRKKSKRQSETKPEAAARKRKNADNMTKSRGAETTEERQKRQRLDAEAHRDRRPPEYLIAINTNTNNTNQITEKYFGGMTVRCQHCQAGHFAGEATGGNQISATSGYFNDCCRFGRVPVPEAEEYPLLLRQLLEGGDRDAKNFQEHIRNYNNAFAFACLGVNLDIPSGRGPFCFRCHGQIYRWLGPLNPEDGRQRTYGQLYILDSSVANAQRLGHPANAETLPNIMNDVGNLIHNINKYAKSYRMMNEVVEDQEIVAALEGTTIPTISMIFENGQDLDMRRYNSPAANEIAVVFVAEDGEVPEDRNVTAVNVRGDSKQINTLDRNCDPLCYPILFPYGEPGWYPNIPYVDSPANSKRSRVTIREFYASRIAVRPGFSSIHKAKKLFQQYVVDAYCKVEEERLKYLRLHQQELRVDSYKGLMDHLAQAAEDRDMRVGRLVILPSTFVGSPRYMIQNYQDAMTIVGNYGKPDLFITCNPKWPEIVENLSEGEHSSDRPDIVSRVFRLKHKELMEDITIRHVMGKPVAWLYVIEYQKRGLPHGHILITLAEENKPRTPEDIDKLVRADIPDPDTEPRLHELVVRHMIHGPCGWMNKNCPGMNNDDKECEKGFPKEHCEETKVNVDGYPQYKRPAAGPTAKVGRHTVDNSWVVPYNAYFLYKYNAHINVEDCATVKSIKYVHKYVYKGHDRAALRLQQTSEGEQLRYDEISAHLDARYVSAPEAVWRLLEFPMQEKSHTIIRLAVHLPNEQQVYFREGKEREAAEKAPLRHSTLTAWFQLNAESRDKTMQPSTSTAALHDSRDYLYTEIPHHYVFHKDKYRWEPRQRSSNELGRMYTVSPIDKERYHLRLLLLHRRGMTSFDDLKTYNGVEYETFTEVAEAMELLKDDREWENCLEEASEFQMPYQLRQLFAVILDNCTPRNPKQLWEKFKPNLVDDYYRQSRSPEELEALAYYDIRDRLQTAAARAVFDTITPPAPPVEVTTEIDYEYERDRGQEMYVQLNPDQRAVVDAVVTAVMDREQKKQDPQHEITTPSCFFVDGPGGTGKTFVYETIHHILTAKRLDVINVASTGIAATLLPNGMTAHKRFELPVPITASSYMSRIKAGSAEAKALKSSSLIMWDEAPTSPKEAFEGVDILLKDITENDEAFGGIVFVGGGDFRQCLPVKRFASRADLISLSLKRSELWHKYFHVYRLEQNMRIQEDPDYATWVLEVGNGTAEMDENGTIELPDEIISSGNIVKEIYGDALDPEDPDSYCQKVILTAKNDLSLKINEDVLDLLPTEARTYLSIDSAQVNQGEDTTLYPTEFLNSLTPSGMPPHKLRLKVGAVVILLRNMNTKRGLCNGVRLLVIEMRDHVLKCKICCGQRKGQVAFIPRIDIAPSDVYLPFTLNRRQFPVRLAFSITINKGQGQTYEKVGAVLIDPAFTHGQLYVCMTRVRRAQDIRVLTGFDANRRRSNRTKNIVYREML